MFYLLEAKYTDNEAQALYSNYTTQIELLSAVETKLGQQMKDNACKAELLVAFDNTGWIYKQAYHSKDDSIALSPRLVWIPADSEGEHPNMQKYDTEVEAEAYYHIRRGDAMNPSSNVDAILTMTIGNKGVTMNEYWKKPVEPVEPQEEVEEQGE